MTIPSNARQPENVADFFERRREWSRWKHEILSGYLPLFSKILGRTGRTVNYVDAFAGRGYYGDDQIGSALIAANLSLDFWNRATPEYALRCINYEKDPDLFRDLCEQTKASEPTLVSNRNEEFCIDTAKRVTAEVGDDPTLFFLDPFGLKGLEWETMRVIGARNRSFKTEIIMNFNAPKLDRHAGWLDSFDQRAQQAFIDFVDRIWPPGHQPWREIHATITDPMRRYDTLCRTYMRALEQEFGFKVVRFPVKRVDTGALKYYIIHATRNATALVLISNIYYSANQHYREAVREYFSGRAIQQELPIYGQQPMSDGERERVLLAYLGRDVERLGREARRISIHDLQYKLMGKYFGRIAEKHLRRICQHLVQRAVIIRPQGIRGIQWREPLRFAA